MSKLLEETLSSFPFPLTGDPSVAEGQGCVFTAHWPRKGGTDPCSVLLTPTWEPGATAVSSSLIQGCVTSPCEPLPWGGASDWGGSWAAVRGHADSWVLCSQGPQEGRGEHLALGAPGCGGSRFLSPSALDWSTVHIQAVSSWETVIISVVLSLHWSSQRGRLARLRARESIWDPWWSFAIILGRQSGGRYWKLLVPARKITPNVVAASSTRLEKAEFEVNGLKRAVDCSLPCTGIGIIFWVCQILNEQECDNGIVKIYSHILKSVHELKWGKIYVLF